LRPEAKIQKYFICDDPPRTNELSLLCATYHEPGTINLNGPRFHLNQSTSKYLRVIRTHEIL